MVGWVHHGKSTIADIKGPSGNKVYILLLAPRPAGKARATSIPAAVCKERATQPAGLRAAAGGARRRAGICGVAAPRRCHHIARVAAPCICPPRARAKMHTLFSDGPLAVKCGREINTKLPIYRCYRLV